MNEATAIAPEETKSTVSVRVIAIRHRTKQTKAGEARPTIVSFYDGKEVKEDKVIKTIELEAEQNEYDWLCGRHPVAWRDLEPDEDISAFAAHHVKYKKLKDGQLVPDGVHASQVKVEDKILSVATKVPSEFDGQQPGDVIVMSLGGSGDNLAFALASRGATLKPRSELRRITPHILKRVIDGYNEEERQNTTEILLKHYGESPSDFHGTEPRDMDVIVLRESFKYRRQVVEARIACAARLRQQQIGALYCSKDGYFPEGEIEKMFADGMANNVILNALTAEEVAANSKLAKACNALDVYTVVFKPIRGIGPSIAARIIGAIIHIGRFPDRAKFRAFCGVHILPDGRLPRKRAGEVANWVGEARQAFYLAGGLFNRNPTSEWGKRLIAAKTAYRVKHPVEVSVGFNFVQNYRKLDNFFRSNKVDTNTIGFDLSTAAGLYAWFVNCRQNLGEQAKKHVEPLGIFEGQIAELVANEQKARESKTTSSESSKKKKSPRAEKAPRQKIVKLFTPGHIHKMAAWYVAGKLAEHIFYEWKKLERGGKKKPGRAAAKLIKMDEAVMPLLRQDNFEDPIFEEEDVELGDPLPDDNE